MSIRTYEFKKAVTSPIIIALVLASICLNIFIVLENTHINDELPILNRIVSKLGHEIDEEMIRDFQNYYNEQLLKLNKITYENTSRTYTSIADFFKEHREQLYFHTADYRAIYSEEERAFIEDLRVVAMYYYEVTGSGIAAFEEIDIMKIAESEIRRYGFGGKAADTVRNVYREFEKRFEQLVENEEHRNLFFLGSRYRMHSFLFRRLFRLFIFEIMVLVVLITAYLSNYEFDNKTQLLAYSTKRGRKLILDKLYASLVVNMFVVTIIIAVGLGVYFIVFDYTGLWHVPISSYFNSEPPINFLSWWNMSFLQYLLWSVGLIYICALLFTGITFLIASFVKNSYIVFFLFVIIFGIILLLPEMASRDSNIIFATVFTPFSLILNPHVWFMKSGAFTTFKYYELITVTTWFVLVLVFASLRIRKFNKQDIF